MTDFVPVNDLEQALVDGRSGRLPLTEFIRLLLRAPLYILSSEKPNEDGTGFAPVMLPHPEEANERMICCFSSPARIGRFSEVGPYLMQVPCAEFLERLPETDIGIVINPDDKFVFELRSPAIQNLMESIRKARTN